MRASILILFSIALFTFSSCEETDTTLFQGEIFGQK